MREYDFEYVIRLSSDCPEHEPEIPVLITNNIMGGIQELLDCQCYRTGEIKTLTIETLPSKQFAKLERR